MGKGTENRAAFSDLYCINRFVIADCEMSESIEDILERNLNAVRHRIAVAATRCGRSPQEITMVAVTKYVDLSIIQGLLRLGQRILGESRPQQLWQRASELREYDIEWHLIGPLQKNKVRKTLPIAAWIHSIDSLGLLEAVDRIAGELGVRPKLLLEVNVSGHPTKHGFRPEEMPSVIAQCPQYRHVTICGLMAMAGQEGDLEGARRDFRALRELRDQLQELMGEEVTLKELSMGMSGDFEIAIEEGATIVRVGSALYEGLSLPL
ncbi:MAG: YggS family pyridoxal phosphate-dependent enzyme [Thermogutta sp.]|nr:YggS family pyridoxal phosphate-dependent enzyme [Thermogutta sp.]HPU05589.1 YggS family pyridoxal phosphate-dependent enzyme [Thermogutta sp.]